MQDELVELEKQVSKETINSILVYSNVSDPKVQLEELKEENA